MSAASRRRPGIVAAFVALVVAGLGVGMLLVADREHLSQRLIGGDHGVALLVGGVGLLWLVSLGMLASAWRAPPGDGE